MVGAASSLVRLREGTVIAGCYRLVQRLGTGGMGEVYEAVHLRTERRCALKVMQPHIVERQDLRERFALEAKVAARIKSEFVVDVFDAGVDAATGAPFLVMELLRGEDLSRRLKRLGRLAPREALRHLHQTAMALERMHRASVVHRDLKPGNLFLAQGENGRARIKVLDFGLAKLVSEGTGVGTATTLGTALYMAPEQFRGGKVTGAVDLYALGMIAYTLLVGEPYWDEELRERGNVIAFGLTAVEGPKEAASARAARRGARLPSGFDPWFTKATAADPAQRFPSARAAMRALAAIFEEELALGRDEPRWDGDEAEETMPRASSPIEGSAEDRVSASGSATRSLTSEGDAARSATRSLTGEGDTTRTGEDTSPSLPETRRRSDPSDALERASPAPVQPPRSAGRAWRWTAAAALLVATVGGALALRLHARPSPEPVIAAPLNLPDAVLACPLLEATGVDEPAGWLGAAAAATVCERARILLGGSASRTLVPAELLSLPPWPVDSFPVDPFGAPDARERSLKAAQRRGAAYIDGEVVKTPAGFSVTLVLRRADGSEISRAPGRGPGLYQAVREAMEPLIARGQIPKARELDPTLREWSRARDVDGALALTDLMLAIAHNAGGLPEECARVQKKSEDLAEMGAIERRRCAYILGLPAPPAEPVPFDGTTPAALGVNARLRHMHLDDDAGVIATLQERLEREPSALGRSLLAATASCLVQKSDPRRASELALAAVQADPKNPLGEFCSPWGQLVSTTRDTASAQAVVRAMQAWAPWDGNGWLWDSLGSADAPQALAYARRAYALTPFDAHVASVVADKLLATGAREEVRNIAVAMARGGYPVHQLASDILLVRVDESEARFGAALARAERAMEVRAEDAGWVRVERFDLAFRALQIAAVLGRAAEVADRIVARFLEPEPPPLDGTDLDVAVRIPAVCARASAKVSRRCFARLSALQGLLSGSPLPEYRTFIEGAERYAEGDWRRAAAAWRPLARQPGMFTAALSDAMEAAFEKAGDEELARRLESAALAAGAGEMNGALPAHARAALRAAAHGERERARALAHQVVDAWSVADAPVPAVSEMRRLLSDLR